MSEEFLPGCQRPSVAKPALQAETESTETMKEAKRLMLKVGKPAPEFVAPAFYKGKFVNTGLSEYKGKWVLLCFYPGDFTFV
jgi:hypothetical protein